MTGVHVTGFWAALAAALLLVVSSLRVGASGPPAMQVSAPGAGIHASFDGLLDLYVREGLVYYRALAAERGALDRYISNLDVPAAALEGWTRETQAAFWLNAYNALVLRTVVTAYPIRGRLDEFPVNSVRQVPGAFERRHRIAGRQVSLDDIERTVLPAFDDPRMYFALGRGSIGGGRLRSEAFLPARLDEQLASVEAECVTRYECFRYDPASDRVLASAIFGWRQDAFIRRYPGEAERFATRSPIERAVLQMVLPHVLPGEREGLQRNTFTMTYQTFDWRLNDLTDGGGR